MTQKEVRATSGAYSGIADATGQQKVESGHWSVRSVSVTISNPSRSERLISLNERLRGGWGGGTSTSK